MIFKIGVLKNFAVFTGKHLCWSLFLITLQVWWPETLLKSDSNAGVFLSVLRNFKNCFFNRIPPVRHQSRHQSTLLSLRTLIPLSTVDSQYVYWINRNSKQAISQGNLLYCTWLVSIYSCFKMGSFTFSFFIRKEVLTVTWNENLLVT